MTETRAMAVRFRLRKLLEEREISQTELARDTKVSLVTINAIANNNTAQVRLATLDAICGVLDVEPGELLERDRRKVRGK